jgi:hypothetical protein
MTPAQRAQLDTADAASRVVGASVAQSGDGAPSPAWIVTAAWLAVGVPIAWGVWVTLHQAAELFEAG